MKSKSFLLIASCFLTTYFNVLFPQQLPVLDITSAIEHPVGIVLSDFIESVRYVTLETAPECLIPANPDIRLTKDNIIITSFQKCLVFDRKTGDFIREIGHSGRGPGEYKYTSGFFEDPSSIFFFTGWNGNLMKYSLDGKFLGSVNIPGYDGSLETPSMPDRFTYLYKNLIVCNFININGLETKSLMIFNSNGEIVKVIPNKHIVKNVNTAINTGTTGFHHSGNSTYCQEFHNDTVFMISSGGTKPHFILNRGKYRPPYESLWWRFDKRRQEKLIWQPVYLESPRFITFEFNIFGDQVYYFALYDKTSKSLKITEKNSGIRNDIDGFMDLSFKSVNNYGELSCLIQPQDLTKWFENNKEKSNSLNPEIQKLKTTNMTDNPIVVIAKYKQ